MKLKYSKKIQKDYDKNGFYIIYNFYNKSEIKKLQSLSGKIHFIATKKCNS